MFGNFQHGRGSDKQIHALNRINRHWRINFHVLLLQSGAFQIVSLNIYRIFEKIISLSLGVGKQNYKHMGIRVSWRWKTCCGPVDGLASHFFCTLSVCLPAYRAVPPAHKPDTPKGYMQDDNTAGGNQQKRGHTGGGETHGHVPYSSCSPPPDKYCHQALHSRGHCDPPGWGSGECSTGHLSGHSTPQAWRQGGRNLGDRKRQA